MGWGGLVKYDFDVHGHIPFLSRRGTGHRSGPLNVITCQQGPNGVWAALDIADPSLVAWCSMFANCGQDYSPRTKPEGELESELAVCTTKPMNEAEPRLCFDL